MNSFTVNFVGPVHLEAMAPSSAETLTDGSNGDSGQFGSRSSNILGLSHFSRDVNGHAWMPEPLQAQNDMKVMQSTSERGVGIWQSNDNFKANIYAFLANTDGSSGASPQSTLVPGLFPNADSSNQLQLVEELLRQQHSSSNARKAQTSAAQDTLENYRGADVDPLTNQGSLQAELWELLTTTDSNAADALARGQRSNNNNSNNNIINSNIINDINTSNTNSSNNSNIVMSLNHNYASMVPAMQPASLLEELQGMEGRDGNWSVMRNVPQNHLPFRPDSPSFRHNGPGIPRSPCRSTPERSAHHLPTSPLSNGSLPPVPSRQQSSLGSRPVPILGAPTKSTSSGAPSLWVRRGLPDLPGSATESKTFLPGVNKRESDSPLARWPLSPAVKSPRSDSQTSPGRSLKMVPISPTMGLSTDLEKMGVNSKPGTPLGSKQGNGIEPSTQLPGDSISGGIFKSGEWTGNERGFQFAESGREVNAQGLQDTKVEIEASLNQKANINVGRGEGLEFLKLDQGCDFGLLSVGGIETATSVACDTDEGDLKEEGEDGLGDGRSGGEGEGKEWDVGGTGGGRQRHSTKPRSVAERQRRERIAIRLQRLKEVMPKTDARIDTSAMLEDAVVYIRSLQSRCKVLDRQNAVLAAQVMEFKKLTGFLRNM